MKKRFFFRRNPANFSFLSVDFGKYGFIARHLLRRR